MAEVSWLAETEVAIGEAHTSIKQKLMNLPGKAQRHTIPRAPHRLIELNKNAYEPCIISIGPYHRGKDHLKQMEEQKVQYLCRLLQVTNLSVEIFLSAMENMVEEVRNCYSEPLDISMEEFVEMMVLDGCFIIQLFLGTMENSFYYRGRIRTILHDLVLVENQLPFFVLCKLLDIIPVTLFSLMGFTDRKTQFIRHILEAFEGYMPGLRVDRIIDDYSMQNIGHILFLLHSNWLPSDREMDEWNKAPKKYRTWISIRSATELREAGIEFTKVEKRSFFDIKFKKGILEMPAVIIDSLTESLFGNLIICEQSDNSPFLTDYITIMDSLINTGKDVELLCKSGIICNMLGEYESVADMFNRLGAHLSLPESSFFYAELFQGVSRHYKSRWNVWKANLKDKYFNSPWAFISFLAACLLLLLTILQTTFTIFPRS